MTIWNSMPYERLRQWHDFRKTISLKSLDQAVQDVCHLWSYAPFVKYYLTWDNLENWPNPWELMYENVYCDLAKALGITYTLYLTDHRPTVDIRIFKDKESMEYYNLVYVQNGKYVINFLHDEIVNKTQINKNFELKKTINISDLKLDQLH